MFQPIRGQGGHLVFFRSARKTQTWWLEDVDILLPVKFRWIPFSSLRGEVQNVSANQRPERPSCFSDRPEKHELSRGRWDVGSKVSLYSIQQFQRRSRKCFSQSEARAAILFFFSIGPKNTNLVARGRWYLASCQVSLDSVQRFQRRSPKCLSQGNQRPGQPSCFSDQSKKKKKPHTHTQTQKLGRGRWDLASCQFSLNFLQRLQGRNRKCLSQSEAGAAILFFRSARHKNKLGRGRWDLASCQVSLNFVQRLQRRSRKCFSQWKARAAILFSDRPEKHKLCRER